MENLKRRDRSRVAGKDPASAADDGSHIERIAQRKRENQQIILYIFICLIVVLAWLFGTWHLSFLWIFCLIVVIFFVWKGKVLSLTEQYIREKELLVHRKRALRQNETAEWLNFVINRWWVFSSNTISDIIKKKIDPLLMDIKPSYLESLELESLSVGDKTPFIKYIQVYECADGVGGGKRPLSLSLVNQPPTGLQQAHQFQLVLEVDVGLQCDEFNMIFHAILYGIPLNITVEKLHVAGLLQVLLRLDMDAPFPHISSASVSFLERPDVQFSINVLKTIPVMEIPLLKTWIKSLIFNILCDALVDPGKVDLSWESTGPIKVLSTPQPKVLAVGVLTVAINGEYQRQHDNVKKDKSASNSPLELMNDLRFCVASVGSQETSSEMIPRTEPWSHNDSFLIYNFKTDKILVDVKSQILLTTQSLAKFEMLLSSLQFDQNHSCNIPLSKKIGENEVVKLSLSLKYTSLPNIEKAIQQGTVEKNAANDCDAGVLYICLHNATNVLGLDSNGFSDPYCVIYINGKKVKCTHYVPRTRNPKWDVCAEVIVKDISKAMLSFVVYDWDGRNVSEDDFLGSANISLNQDKPVLIRKSLNLGYNVMAQDAKEDNKLGAICVTLIFRSIASIANQTSNLPKESRRVSKIDNKLPGSKRQSLVPTTPGANDEEGVVEITILQAKKLVPKDRNGFSDPFCEVKVNDRRRFVTSVKKKTLDPIWNETVSTQAPKSKETLEIYVWDQDALFQKDFLGYLSFTLQDLKQYSDDLQHDGWFQLQRIESGALQLRFKVVMPSCQKLTQPVSETDTTKLKREASSSESRSEMSSVYSEAETVIEQGKPNDLVPSAELNNQLTGFQLENTPVQDSSSQKLTRKLPGSVPWLRKTTSEVAINGVLNDEKNKGQTRNEVPVKSSSVVDMPSSIECYYGVRGRILSLHGLQNSASSVYFKIRLISPLDEKQKRPSSGHVLIKSNSFHTQPKMDMDINFEVDQGHGVHMKSLLMFDVKAGRYSHIAVRGFTLDEILNDTDDNTETTKWLHLNKSVKVKVQMSYMGRQVAEQLASSGTRRSHSFLGGLRSSTLKKIKEQ